MKVLNFRSSQVLGPALYLLSEYYIFRCANETEKAIARLLQQVSGSKLPRHRELAFGLLQE